MQNGKVISSNSNIFHSRYSTKNLLFEIWLFSNWKVFKNNVSTNEHQALIFVLEAILTWNKNRTCHMKFAVLRL